ncbi:DUF916 and DUF3324 domain-containing protein [Levilactobacillus suantsaii]|nr:DUF916 and DUF3324 domain-containing protein [Levilactobacillus suantsaii]
MRRGWQWFVMLVGIWLGLLGGVGIAHAQGVGFTVQPVKPSNQTNTTLGYFSLRMAPQQQQKLTIVIRNQSSTTQRFRVRVNQAVTNANGIIDYSQADPDLDPSLQLPMKQLFSQPVQTVSVPESGAKRVTLALKMPAERLRGCALGGIYVEQLTTSHPVSHSQRKLTVNNQFAYAISILLTESTRKVTPDLRLRQVKVGQLNQRDQVFANLQNFEPGVLSPLSLHETVTAQNSSQVLLKQDLKSLGMAPNSNFNAALPWGNTQLKAGTYTLNLTAQSGQRQWHFTRNFVVTPKQLRGLGGSAVTPTATPTSWLYWLLAAIIALLLAIIGYLIARNRRRKKE